MKLKISILIVFLSAFIVKAQTKTATIAKPTNKESQKVKLKLDLEKINDSIPDLIPKKKDGKFGFINQKRKVIIPYLYSNVGFFTEDCNLLHSNNEKVIQFGSKDYASVRKNNVDYRIDKSGKIVYKYKDEDLVKCPFEFKKQMFHSFIRQGFYGIVNMDQFFDENDYRQYIIYPQFEYLHIMEGDDIKNPMIIAVKGDKFGVIDTKMNVIIPFIYSDIKRNFSWKLARLFEVTEDGKNYFYIDDKNNRY